ncbi:unnamed protein product [Rotaria magnacalcarata]|uniref:Uncharacterized protein n=2 Tax=Rotaria magnacalcarata TaxID=392030 RepID=A0A8S2Q8K4_9BILA|nr:unnamed protein product [Rotaria magnacalcarata]
MMKLPAFIIILCYLCHFCNCGTLPAAQQAEQTLITSLLSSYNNKIRPDTQVSVDITASIQQIVAIDEKQQIMTSTLFISQTWYDNRLSWTPSSNNNITVVMLPVSSLWIPDTMIVNSADTSGYLTVNTYSLASVNYSGQVYMILPALSVKTRCSFNVKNFPFDKQMCSINLTSWGQGINRILYTEDKSLVVDSSEYSEHPLWALNGTDLATFSAADRSPFEDTSNDVLAIQLYLERKPLYFIMNGIFACLVLNCVTLLAYTLPFGSQIGLCMTCFMTYSVYSLNFSSLFPQQSQYVMIITFYFLLSMCFTLTSMIWFIICNHFASKSEIPAPLYGFSGELQKLLWCFPAPKEEKKPDKMEKVVVENFDVKKSTMFENMKCVSCQKLFSSCLHRQTRVENLDEKADIKVDKVESDTIRPVEVTPIETTTDAKVDETNETTKPKCNFCNRCETCQADFDKDKAKGKTKKDIEARCSALNYFVFSCMLLFMFVSNMTLWLYMSS